MSRQYPENMVHSSSRSTTSTERGPTVGPAFPQSPYPEQINIAEQMSRASSRNMAASPTLVADSDYGSSAGSSYYSWSGSETTSTMSSFDSPRSYASFSSFDSYSSAETERGRPLTRHPPPGVPFRSPTGSAQLDPRVTVGPAGRPFASNIYAPAPGPPSAGYWSSQGSEAQYYSGDQVPEGGRSNTPGHYDHRPGWEEPWVPRSEINAEDSASWRRPGIVKSDDIYSFAGSAASGSASGSNSRRNRDYDASLWGEYRGRPLDEGWDSERWDRSSDGSSDVTESEATDSDSDDDSYYSDDCSSCASGSTGYESLDYYPEPYPYRPVPLFQRW